MIRRGWYGQSFRHSLAARGIATNSSYLKAKRTQGAIHINNRALLLNSQDKVMGTAQLKEFSIFDAVRTLKEKHGIEVTEDAKQKLRELPVGDWGSHDGVQVIPKEELSDDEKKELKDAGYMKKKKTIPIIAEKHEEGRAYPVSKEEVKKVIDRQGENAKGITAVRLQDPTTAEEMEAWARYKRGKRELVIFSQPIQEMNGDVNNMMCNEVIPHEVGHHVALYKRKITDKNIEVAEARADAHAAGFDVEDRDIHKFRQDINHTHEHTHQRAFVEEGGKKKAYNYTPAYVAGDLPLIAADGIGTAGAATVALIPLAVTVGAVYVGAKIIKNSVDKTKKSTKKQKKAKK